MTDNHETDLTQLQAAVEENPGDLDAIFELAQAHISRDEWEKAVAVYEHAMVTLPESGALANDLAVLYDDARMFEEAESYYRRALELDPKHGPTYINLGTLLAAQGHEEEAAETFRAGMAQAADEEDRHEAERYLQEMLATEDDETIVWVPVSITAGITVAEALATRLRAAGIPARATQEGAGQALGLTMGPLGTGTVLVPEDRSAEARRLLAEDERRTPGEAAVYEDDEGEDGLTMLAKGALAATAFVVSPLGSAASALLSGLFDDEEFLLPCPHCETELELSEEEWDSDSITCPSCGEPIDMTALDD